MNKDIKKQWVAALTSTEYTQRRGNLKSLNANGGTSHCCLGVLCELHAKSHPEAKWGLSSELGNRACYLAGREQKEQFILLPQTVAVWAGFHDAATLITLNDGARAPFAEIAAYIEENY